MLGTISSMHCKGARRALLAALVLLCAKLSVAGAPPVPEKQDAKESSAVFRAYLPTIRLKVLRDNERKAGADLETWLGWSEVWVEAGLINLVQRSQIEEEYHRSRLRALRLDTDYRDSLDQFTSRYRISAEQRRQMEDAATSPLTKHFQRFREFTHDSKVALYELEKIEAEKDAKKLRPGAIKLLTKSALVKKTKLPKRFLKSWDDWKKINDISELRERTTKNREALDRLRKLQNELAEKQRELSDADRQRMETLKFETGVGEFQLVLLEYEKQPWKDLQDDAKRSRRRRQMLYPVDRCIQRLLDHADEERRNRLNQSWPRLAPVRVKDVDLLVGEADKAEGTVSSLLKTPDAQRIGKKKLRHLRTLAEGYPIQKRLCYIAFVRIELLKKAQGSPTVLEREIAQDLEKLVGRKEPRPTLDKNPYEPEPLLKREAAFRKARKQLLQTWIDYQMLRLDLYNALGIAPPER